MISTCEWFWIWWELSKYHNKACWAAFEKTFISTICAYIAGKTLESFASSWMIKNNLTTRKLVFVSVIFGGMIGYVGSSVKNFSKYKSIN